MHASGEVWKLVYERWSAILLLPLDSDCTAFVNVVADYRLKSNGCVKQPHCIGSDSSSSMSATNVGYGGGTGTRRRTGSGLRGRPLTSTTRTGYRRPHERLNIVSKIGT